MVIDNQFSGLTKNLDGEDKIALILKKAPKDYSGILSVTKEKKGDVLTMNDL